MVAMTLRERCHACGHPLLRNNGRLVCGNPHCTTGHNAGPPNNVGASRQEESTMPSLHQREVALFDAAEGQGLELIVRPYSSARGAYTLYDVRDTARGTLAVRGMRLAEVTAYLTANAGESEVIA